MSSFRKHICNHQHFKKTFVSPGKILRYHVLAFLFQSLRAGKRISFFLSLYSRIQNRCISCKGSMAVEAALAVPFFLFFILNILFSFEMLRLHGNITAAMHQTGNRMAFYGYGYRNSQEEEALPAKGADSLILSQGYARLKVINILGKDYLNHTCLANGAAGIHFGESSVMESNDIIDLRASYRIRPFIQIEGFPDFAMANRYYGRAWTGFDVEQRQNNTEEEDSMVYVTETGSVYHISRNCTYLNPSVTAVSSLITETIRNENGEKYYACDRCDYTEFQAVVYITTQGNKIHGSLSCSGLKRTIYSIHLSETGGRGQCSKCG